MSASTKTIVLLPGFMLDDTLWDDFVPHLPADWNVQRVALPQGRTVREVAQGLADRLARPAAVVGFSMGGYVARALAVAHPPLVEALVLVDSGHAPGQGINGRTCVHADRASGLEALH